jgi:hypothetical protein
MEVEKIIEAPYITIKRQTQRGIKRLEVNPDVVVLEKDARHSFTKYGVYCGVNPLGYVSLIDKKNGVWVDYIKNYAPERYSGFGKIADQIEVEHCLNRGLKDFEVLSDATPASLVFHYKRGKRFDYIADAWEKINLKKMYGTFNVNVIIERLLKKSPNPETLDIGTVPMFMPKDLIKKYIDIIKLYPLLKR